MAKAKLHVYIPGLPQPKTDEQRHGDSILVYDDDKHAVLIDGGESVLFSKMESYLRKNFTAADGYAHVTFILTHWHGDHDCGLKSALESHYIFVDEIYAPDPEELKLVPRDDGNSEYARAMRRIQLAKDLNKKIIYPPAGKRVGHWVGRIRMWMWRQKANPADFVDYQVNNTSLQTYFPDLEFLTGGDSITATDKFLNQYPTWKITGFKIWHHGNACTYSTCDKLTEHGAQICYYTDWEPAGKEIGTTTFSKYGAGRTKQYFTTLRPFSDINITADGMGHVEWEQDGRKWAYNVEYGRSEAIPAPDKGTETVPLIRANTGFKGYNVSKRTDAIKYVVIHYVGAESSAEDNVKYFNAADRQASADYFVGHNGEIYEYNPDVKKQYSWHCGGGTESAHHPYYGICKNGNSIGIELCTKKSGGAWTFSRETVDAAAILTRYIMKQYGILAANVIRHYDVTGKACPRVSGWGAVGGDAAWAAFKASLTPATVDQIYRVRKAWNDPQSQLGAFSSLENARAMRDKNDGYYIFDSAGNMIN